MVALLKNGPMTGMFINHNLILILFSISLLACSGKRVTYKEFTNQFDSKYNLSLGESESSVYFTTIAELDPIKRNSLSLYTDLDGDGVVDYHDQDIDGDGIHNYADSYPMDAQIGGEDLNGDGIIDFIFNEKYQELQRMYKDKEVHLVFNNSYELDSLTYNTLIDQDFLKNIKDLKCISFSSLDLNKYADYNSQWKAINIYPQALSNRAHESLIHESFHHYASIENEFYALLIAKLEWMLTYDEYGMESYELATSTKLPSDYAFTDPKESFAEVMTYFYTMNKNIPMQRFKRSEEFKMSSDYLELESLILEQLF